MPRKTYIAFDASGMMKPISNLPTFLLFERYQRTFPNRFQFINMDEIKFAAEHDGQVPTTIQHRFRQKMEEADNVLLVASPVIDVQSAILNWQLEMAVYRYRLPLIVAYAHTDRMTEDAIDALSAWHPTALAEMLRADHGLMAHIPLTVNKLERALAAFSKAEATYPWTSRTIF